jgi:hypothetical protein
VGRCETIGTVNRDVALFHERIIIDVGLTEKGDLESAEFSPIPAPAIAVSYAPSERMRQ